MGKNAEKNGEPAKKYKTKYTPDKGDALIKIMASGGSRADFCSKSNISYKTFDNWRKKYPEFQEAYEEGLPKAEAWWQRKATEHIVHQVAGDQLNSVAWSMNMRNRFGWTEHRTIELPGLTEGKTAQEKFDILAGYIENGKYTGTEITALTNLLSVGLKIMEQARLEERLDELEALLEAKKEDEKIG